MKEISATILLAVLLFGCSEPLTTREKGAAIGTVSGAGLGAIIGSATGNAGAGTGPSSSGIVRLLGRLTLTPARLDDFIGRIYISPADAHRLYQ